MTDLVLVRTRNNPAIAVKAKSDSGKYSGRLNPPYGIMYIAAYCRMKGHSVEVMDLFHPDFDDMSIEQVADKVLSHSPRYVGVSCMTSQSVEAMQLGDVLMRKAPDVKVVHGGVHPATLPEDAIEHGHLVIQGDGEHSMHELLAPKPKLNVVDGAAPEGDLGSRIIRGKLLTVEEMDSVGAFQKWQFDETGFDPKMATHFPIITARGCPYRCVFCKDGFGLRQSKVRYHSVDLVAEQLEIIQRVYGFENIIVLDDIFLSSEERMEALADELDRRKLKFKFQCQVHANTVKPGFMKLMHRLGVEWVYLGIESGNPDILKKINKGTTIEKITTAVHRLKANDFNVAGMFMLGNIGETKETIEQTIRFAYELPTDRTWFSFAAPYPGTPFYDMVDEYGTIIEPDFGKWNQTSLVYLPRGISMMDMYKLMAKAQAVRVYKKLRFSAVGQFEGPLRKKLGITNKKYEQYTVQA